MKNNNRIAALGLFVVVLMSSCSSPNAINTQQDAGETSSNIEVEESIVSSEVEEMNPIDSFVEAFNESSVIDLVYVEDFTPSDRSSSHYRTEFRLNAYSEAIAKSYSFDGATVDLVYKEDIYGDAKMRVYMDGATFEQCELMIRFASPIMDTAITEEEIDETIDYINGNVIAGRREANGYFYSNLAIVLFERTEGCTLMIKMQND